MRDALAEGHPIDARRVVTDVARAMLYVHSLGLCHRDLKAANVLLDGTGRAKVSDRGER